MITEKSLLDDRVNMEIDDDDFVGGGCGLLLKYTS